MDEVKCSVVKIAFFAILSIVPVVHGGPGGLVSEVIVSVVESTGVSPTVIDPVMEATDSELDI